ncbi:MAG: hypothetical protein IPK81_03425 [Rhodospirillales bacterium]|nr:MAG: hypothetical protein IPK81_03425 [Rhodospirillales bacterium]
MTKAFAGSIHAIVAAAVIAFLPAAAASQPAPAAGETIPQSAICVARTGTTPERYWIDKSKLLGWLLKNRSLSFRAIDVNGDWSMSAEEITKAYSSLSYCSTIAKGRCSGADDDNQTNAWLALQEILASNGAANGYIVRATPNTPGGTMTITALIDPRGPALDIECRNSRLTDTFSRQRADVAKADAAKAAQEAETARRIAQRQLWIPDEPRGFRLAGKREDLFRERTGKPGDLLGIKIAGVNMESDRRKNLTTYNVEAFAGYSFKWQKWKKHDDEGKLVDDGNQFFWVTPYVQVERFLTNERQKRVDKLGGGFIADYKFVAGWGAFDHVTLSPGFITDGRAKTQIGTVKATWSPGFLFSPDAIGGLANYVGQPGPISALGLNAMLVPIVLGQAGKVFDSNHNAQLRANSTYVRLGGEIGVVVRADRIEGRPSFFDQFELDASYRYLEGVAGKLNHYSLFRVGATYLFPDNEHLAIRLEYKNGRVEDTLQRVETVTLSFGARF